jgi:hypothetical protein
VKRLRVKRGHDVIATVFDTFMVSRKSWIAGGFARWSLSRAEKPVEAGDLDIFCQDIDVFGNIYERFINSGFKVRNDNPACISFLKSQDEDFKHLPSIQLIKPRNEGSVVTMGTIEEIFENFDFTVTRAALYSKTKGYTDDHFKEDEERKRLQILNIHCPISSTFRIMKYNRKGYTVSIREVVKLFLDWEQRDDAYRGRLLDLLKKDLPTQEEIDELEALIRID